MAALIPLSTWWQRPAESRVVVYDKNLIKAAEFEDRVSAWVSLLETYSGQRWAVFHSDAAEFLAIICALWQLSRTACIPGDKLPDTISRLSSQVDGFIGQFDLEQTLQLQKNALSDQKTHWQTVAKNHPAIEVYTSGSTGKPKAITKTMGQLESELIALDCLMPAIVPEVVVTTVSHQHLYGLTFRLFRPFSYQQAFTRYLSEYPEDLIAQAQHHDCISLVSSPAHLGRMSAGYDWHLIQQQCSEIYSSAAPLSRADSMHVSHCLNAPVKEIYGSSETGAIAWRCQQHSDQDALWQPLSHVELERAGDETLNVRLVEIEKKINLADKVIFNEKGQFSLHERVDHIGKVEGKRVSFTEMEQVLQSSNLVKQAKTLMLTRQRVETAGVLVLSEQGEVMLNQAGRKSLITELKQLLSRHFETVVIPKRWRYVQHLPYNSQGKLPHHNLVELFANKAKKWPEIIHRETDEYTLVLTCQLPADLIYFDGHFEQQGILPGIVQVHWAEFYAREYLSVQGRFKCIEALKFQQLLMPEQTVSINLQFDPNKQKLFFSYDSERGAHSSGRICYE